MTTSLRRVGATAIVVKDAQGTHAQEAISKLQATVSIDVFTAATLQLTAELRSDLSVAMTKIPWRINTDVSAVVRSLMPAVHGQKAPRRSLQNYTSLYLYGSETFWNALLSKGHNSLSKLQLICNLGMAMGLRLPSEPALNTIASLWCFGVRSPESLMTMTGAQKATYLAHVKATWTSAKAKIAAPVVWVEHLPASTLECSRDYPAIFQGMFRGDELPITPPIDVNALMQFDQSYGCRGGSTKVSSFKLPDGPASPKRHEVEPSFLWCADLPELARSSNCSGHAVLLLDPWHSRGVESSAAQPLL